MDSADGKCWIPAEEKRKVRRHHRSGRTVSRLVSFMRFPGEDPSGNARNTGTDAARRQCPWAGATDWVISKSFLTKHCCQDFMSQNNKTIE